MAIAVYIEPAVAPLAAYRALPAPAAGLGADPVVPAENPWRDVLLAIAVIIGLPLALYGAWRLITAGETRASEMGSIAGRNGRPRKRSLRKLTWV